MTKENGFEVIGIAGPTCSRKTSLVSALERKIDGPVTVLPFDDYDLYPVGSDALHDELVNPTITNWEDPALFDMRAFAGDVIKLANGEAISIKSRSRESIALGVPDRVIIPEGLIVVEGIFALHDPNVRDVMDHKIYVDISMEEMIKRRLSAVRPLSDNNPWDSYDYITGPMVNGTLEFVVPQKQHADLWLNGQLPTIQLATAVVERLDIAA